MDIKIVKKYCVTHKLENMIDLIHKKCKYENCDNYTSYGYKNSKKEYCTTHKLENMINLCKKYCTITDCFNKIFDNSNFCKDHYDEIPPLESI